jgi:hypothetical protein
MLIGFLMALCVALALGAASGTGGGPGPYQCCAADDLSVFVIDTQTGQTWRLGRTENYDFGTPFERKSLRKSITPMVE